MHVKWIEFREERDHLGLMWPNKAVTGRTDGLYIKQLSTGVSYSLSKLYFSGISLHFHNSKQEEIRSFLCEFSETWKSIRDPYRTSQSMKNLSSLHFFFFFFCLYLFLFFFFFELHKSGSNLYLFLRLLSFPDSMNKNVRTFSYVPLCGQ